MANEATITPAFQLCENPACEIEFKFRKNKKTCSAACRKAVSRLDHVKHCEELGFKRRDRDCEDGYDTAMLLAHQYYNTPPQHREDLVRHFINLACSILRYRRALTAPNLIRPKGKQKNTHLFLRGLWEHYRTIAEIVHSYCQNVFRRPLSSLISDAKRRGVEINFERIPYRGSMHVFDTPFAYVTSVPEVLSREAIEEKLANRPQWVKQMVLDLHAAQAMPEMMEAA